ncbi:MAG TPA: LysR family transcriptional regulator [Spongiibacteraceae bacterium]|jgi:DNA-binding transcriptional LysR family regulator|nr:LysR family transcriptional regulator [Spongiibacteraceae bacterium]HUH37932.1 LysR family transcriptional regulator [Spongiibacteraceae bacterium]
MARWDGIYEFVRVVECDSFSGAAERLGISNSQVSKLVARLEDRLGVRLLNRTTRRLTLTEEGEHFYLRCKRTIDEFESAEQDLSSLQNDPRGTLRINMAGSFQEHFIVPMLADFLKAYPGLSVELDFSDQPLNLVSHGHDVAICEGELADSSLVARKLADNHHYLVAHPDYLARHGSPQTVDELQQHNCLTGAQRVWSLSDGTRQLQVKVQGNWQSKNEAALLSAARAGLGIAQLPFFSVLEDIAQGRLVQVLPAWSQHTSPVWIIYPQSRHLTAKVRVFVDYLVDYLRALRV